jgi:hypothetical protein
MRQGCLLTFIQYSTRIPRQSNKAREEIGIQNRKERNQITPTCRWYDLYLKVPKRLCQKILRSDKHYGKVADYKINAQKNQLLFCIPEQAEKEIGKTKSHLQ